jgi:hypothetical protein
MPTAPNRYHVARRSSKDLPKIIILALLVLIGALFIYATILSHLLIDLMLGPNPDPQQVARFNLGLANLDILVFPITLLALLALLIYGAEALFRFRGTRRAAPPTCPRCGTIESAAWQFARRPIQGMGWETVTCPQCRHEWHSKL